MRMRILIGGRSVRGPARVANAETALRRLLYQSLGEPLVDLALLLPNRQVGSIDYRHPGAVVTAVLQPAQSLKENGRRRFLADISDNATHSMRITVCLMSWLYRK